MTEDKFKEAQNLRNNLKKYADIERATKPENNYRLYVGFTGKNDVAPRSVIDFLDEDWPQLEATIKMLTLAAIEVRRNKLQSEFDNL